MAKKYYPRGFVPSAVEETQKALRRFMEEEDKPKPDKEYPEENVHIMDIDDLVEYEDYDDGDLYEYEFHATGDTGE